MAADNTFDPSMAMGAFYQTLAHSTGILYQNAVAQQQQLAMAAQAATNQGVIQIYSICTDAAVATTAILHRTACNHMLALLKAR